MKTNKLFLPIIAIVLIAGLFSSCKKEKTEINNVPEAKAEQLDAISEGSITISTEVHSFMNEGLMVALDSGYNVDNPPSTTKSAFTKSFRLKSASTYNTMEWSGPDHDGWYTRYFSGLYNYYEKARKTDSIMDYIRVMEYHGGDGSYSNTTTTKYIKYLKNKKELFKGYSKWEIASSGYNDISKMEMRIEFSDWNPLIRAGVYDWYWGVSENSGGETVPMFRYEHITATETLNNWLHCRVIYYEEDGTETWDFEFDTPYVEVIMPEIPDVPES